jgi:hypothetical protein
MSDEKLTAETTFFLNDGTVNEEIARIGPDGVWVNPNLPLDEAARKFLDIVNDMWGAHFTRPAVQEERARIRAMVQPLLDEWLAAYGEPALQAYDAGRVHALRDVLDILDGKDVSHE